MPVGKLVFAQVMRLIDCIGLIVTVFGRHYKTVSHTGDQTKKFEHFVSENMQGRKLGSVFQFGCMLLLCLLVTDRAFAEDATPVGVWLDASKRIEVKITPCGDYICGKLLWFKWPDDAQGLPVVDLKNKNAALRNRALLGLVILRNLHPADDNTWEDGEIYNPDDGENYHVKMSIEDDKTLQVRVYELVPIFGETHTWTRIAQNCVGRHNDEKCPE